MGDKDNRDTSAGRGTPGADELAGPPNPRQHSELGLDPDQHSERGINPVQHSERSQQPAKDKDKPKGDEDERTGEGTGGRAGEYK